MDDASTAHADRMGVIATDPLRVLGLQALLPELEVVHLSGPGALGESHLALVLIDSSCTTHLFELIATFRHLRPQMKLLVLGNQTDPEYIKRVVGTGARGYLSLAAGESEIRMAVDVVRDGSVWAPRKVLARLLDSKPGGLLASNTPPHFTARELEVLALLRAGRSNREIGVALAIDESTVKAHIGRLLRKVGVNNRIALTMHPFTQIE
jgi:DNA-binding NarL/FixJ family response regulator